VRTRISRRESSQEKWTTTAKRKPIASRKKNAGA